MYYHTESSMEVQIATDYRNADNAHRIYGLSGRFDLQKDPSISS